MSLGWKPRGQALNLTPWLGGGALLIAVQSCVPAQEPPDSRSRASAFTPYVCIRKEHPQHTGIIQAVDRSLWRLRGRTLESGCHLVYSVKWAISTCLQEPYEN